MAVVAAMATAGCELSDYRLGPELPLRLETRLDRTAVDADDSVRITLTVTNPVPYDVTVEFPSTCQVGYQIETPEGEVLGPHFACGQAITERTFHAGPEAFSWYWRPTVAPGSYRVVTGLGSVPLRARSEPVPLTVR